METIEIQKSELIQWIDKINDQKTIEKLISFKEESLEKTERKFGDGKYLISYIADDFNDPIDHFDEDTKP